MRLQNTMRNTTWNLIGQFVFILLGLVFKRILLHTVGIENIGLNYLFNDIVSLLSIMELGLTGIIAYHLYEPLATGNGTKVRVLMDFFRKSYATIGLLVAIVGIGIIPFFGIIVGETNLDKNYIIIVFLLFLLRSVESYFFSYKQILPYADQKSYIITVVDMITTVLYTIFAIVVLYFTKSFIYVIILEICKKFVADFIIIYIVNRKYPYLLEMSSDRINQEDRRRIFLDIKNAFVSKISIAIIGTTDNIVMSMFLGITITGLYSNYYLAFYTIQTLLDQLISSAQASLGNLLVERNRDLICQVMKKMSFISFMVVSISGCCLIQLSTPFVAFWFGEEYRLSEIIVWVSTLNIFLYILQLPMMQLSDAGGLFKHTKKINLIGCFINILFTLLGVKLFGLVGIFLATSIARIVEFYLRIILNYKEIIKASHRNYVQSILGYCLVFLVEVCIVLTINRFLPMETGVVQIFIYLITSSVIPFLINYLIYKKTKEYEYMISVGRMMVRRMITVKK